MKNKLLLALLLLPLAVFGANTNMWDNGWFTSSIRITAGTPAAGKVLVSDASGFGTWTVVASGTGNAFTNVAGVTGGVQGWSITNTFNAPEFFSGAGLLPPLQWPDFNPRAGELPMVVVGPSVFGDNATLLIGSTNGTIFRGSNDFFAFSQLAGNATLSTFGGSFKVNNPTAAMTIAGNGGSSVIGHTTQADMFALNGVWTFATNVLVSSMGRVGIGTNAPSSLLEVRGNAGDSTNIPMVIIRGTPQRNFDFLQVITNDTGVATIINKKGWIGIGQTNVTLAALEIMDDTAGIRIIRKQVVANNEPFVMMADASNPLIGMQMRGIIGTNGVRFTSPQQSPYEWMRMTDAGVGIFTNAPAQRFHVNGHAQFESNVVINGNTTFGDSSADTVTFNAATGAIPNGLNIGSGRIDADADGTNYVGIPFIIGNKTTVRLLITTNTAGSILLTNLNGTGSIVIQ